MKKLIKKSTKKKIKKFKKMTGGNSNYKVECKLLPNENLKLSKKKVQCKILSSSRASKSAATPEVASTSSLTPPTQVPSTQVLSTSVSTPEQVASTSSISTPEQVQVATPEQVPTASSTLIPEQAAPTPINISIVSKNQPSRKRKKPYSNNMQNNMQNNRPKKRFLKKTDELLPTPIQTSTFKKETQKRNPKSKKAKR